MVQPRSSKCSFVGTAIKDNIRYIGKFLFILLYLNSKNLYLYIL